MKLSILFYMLIFRTGMAVDVRLRQRLLQLQDDRHGPMWSPTEQPTEAPTWSPTESPTWSPTESPTTYPTFSPTSLYHTTGPTGHPTVNPTMTPSAEPTTVPTEAPTAKPTVGPTCSNPATVPKPSGPPVEVIECFFTIGNHIFIGN